jgi:N-methylhydantoinase A/oxoprolinase/acetone carboxylase beta subunit/N-methylhydantoinase B/oxoprolinase/acetone carboxylase alpha subunit
MTQPRVALRPGSARIGVDVGGTFTDVIRRDFNGQMRALKLLSTPPDYETAVVDGTIRVATMTGPTVEVSSVVHGTTVGTNAVLERRGARLAFVTTAGFRDVLELRRLRVPRLYEPFWVKPSPLVPRRLRFEVRERMTAQGIELQELDLESASAVVQCLQAESVQAVAVCFLHAHLFPRHEQQFRDILRAELPDVHVTLSSDLLRERGEYERSATAVVNAYIAPLMGTYISNITTGLDKQGLSAPLTIMQSSGGVMRGSDAAARPVFALESGPAAGVVAAQGLGARLGYQNILTFDMGGTTAKASLIEAGEVARGREYEAGGAVSVGSKLMRGGGELLRIPTIDIAEVGAGGGSIAALDGAGTLVVSTRSAGANPGPACYGLGGREATVTDANVCLGYIPTGPIADGSVTISSSAARDAVGRLAAPLGSGVETTAKGIHSLANANMIRALRRVSSERGRDPRDFALMAYGGSGPVHAAGLAEELGITTVLVPAYAGLFSAVGLLFARPESYAVTACMVDLADITPNQLAEPLSRMQDELTSVMADQPGLSWKASVDVRCTGQTCQLEVALRDQPSGQLRPADVAADFRREYARLYGVTVPGDAPLELTAVRLAVCGPPPGIDILRPGDDGPASSPAKRYLALEGASVPVLRRAWIGETAVAGPMIIDEYDTSVIVPHGWSVRREPLTSTLILTRTSQPTGTPAPPVAAADPVTQHVFANALAAVADEMADTIFRTAHSTVVRDAMDFSTALCDRAGQVVAQAVTVPFHLGSIPAAMETLFERYGSSIRDGDIFILNDPFEGGMHLPDIFIIQPFFWQGTLVAFAVTIAHHADVGGRLAGSSASDNTTIFQDGLRLPWCRLYDAGVPAEDIFRIIKANVRVPASTIGDINAQLAACSIAQSQLARLLTKYELPAVTQLMDAILNHTETLVRRQILAWPDGSARFTDFLDSNGIEAAIVEISVTVTIAGDTVVADFCESADMVPGSLNSTKSFVAAAVFSAIRSALDGDIPYTAGAFRPIEVITRPGSVVDVVMPGASSMRGVTGFRAFDAVNGALAQLIPERVAAAGEGGNTLAIFGGKRPDGSDFVYYEVVAGTWGATCRNDGNDGLMNPNSTGSNIPVEAAETEFPILIEAYGFVPDTGGAGQYRGGLAICRSWRPLVDSSLLVRSDRQAHAPYGLSGGQNGNKSSNVIEEAAGASRVLGPMFSTQVGAGSIYAHVTAGGGGWGNPADRAAESVAADVADGKVSAEAARDRYGVVLNADGTVHDGATLALRDERRRRGT